MRALPNNKGKGESGVTNEMLKYATNTSMVYVIHWLINTIITIGVIPDKLNLSIIKPLVKDENKSTMDMNNIRPISLSETLANVFEKVLLTEIDGEYEHNKKQFGFTKNNSCAHAVAVLNEALKLSKFRNNKAFVVAIDASKAFDKMNRYLLWQKMIAKINPVIV